MKAKVTHYKNIDLTPTQLKDIFTGKFIKGHPIYIKIHFGEPGNTTAFTPETVRPFTDALHDLGFETILWDTPVFYHSPRDTKAGYEKVVKDKGFTAISPCEICDTYEEVELHDGKTAELADIIAKSKNFLVLTHVKGHPSAGFGASIKNIGIGAVSPRTKGLIHEIESPGQKYGWDPDRLGEVVGKAYERMPDGHTLFINIIRDVTKHCDCVAHTTPIIAPDLGVLVSDNIVAVDQASLDLIESATHHDLFLDENHIDPRLGISATAKYTTLPQDYQIQEK